MKWRLKTPKYGDVLRVQIGDIYHYGIYVSDGEVVQFGLPPVTHSRLTATDVKVLTSDVSVFSANSFVEVGELSLTEKLRARTPRAAVAYARGKIGTGGYHLLYNNCEHFVNECLFRKKASAQVDDVRAFVRKIPKTDVYVAKITEDTPITPVSPKSRQREIEKCKNPAVKRQKYLVWRLLSFALSRSFFTDAEKADLKKTKSGKWTSSACHISLSHSDNYVAVAVSNQPVGIDAERINAARHPDALFLKIAGASERDIPVTPENFTLLWTKKESIYKKSNLPYFSPKTTDTRTAETKSYRLDGETVLTLAADNFDNLGIYLVSDFEKPQFLNINNMEEMEYVL